MFCAVTIYGRENLLNIIGVLCPGSLLRSPSHLLKLVSRECVYLSVKESRVIVCSILNKEMFNIALLHGAYSIFLRKLFRCWPYATFSCRLMRGTYVFNSLLNARIINNIGCTSIK